MLLIKIQNQTGNQQIKGNFVRIGEFLINTLHAQFGEENNYRLSA